MSDRVELRQLVGKNVATRAVERTRLYRIFLDGHQVGYKHMDNGPVAYIVSNLTDIDKSVVEEHVSAIMECEVESVECPPIPQSDIVEERPEYDDFIE